MATNAARRARSDTAGGGSELIVTEDLHHFLGEMERQAHWPLDGFLHCDIISPTEAQHALIGSASGIVRENVAPRPSALSTEIVPLCASMMALQM